jgi:uncharacterized membrane protein YfcA
MDAAQVFGYFGAFLTGLILGLLGGGGALISIPVLVYLFHIEASVATGYSLFLIGITASTGAVTNLRKKTVDLPTLLYYGLPSVVSIYCMRRYIVPAIPDVIFQIGAYQLTKNNLILTLLSVVIFAVAYNMISTNKVASDNEHHSNYTKLIATAIFIGAFLGMVGAGGGFLMIPALFHYANLDMKKSIGTSLVLVAINSFVGFWGDVHSNQTMEWSFLFAFSSFSVVGMFTGSYWAGKTDNRLLKKYFAWFMLAVGSYILIKEIFF